MSTTTPELARPADSLDQLADRANGKHREAYQAAMTMLYAGIAAGEALNEAKGRIGHGGWQAWCGENLEFATTTACNYMLVARHKEVILAADGIDTMQKAISYLKANKLTSQTRIDDERIQLIRETASEHGYTRAARILGESFDTVRKYAQGFEKTKRVKPPGSGTQRQVAITDDMIERLAYWMAQNLAKPPRHHVSDRLREVAVDALRAALAVE